VVIGVLSLFAVLAWGLAVISFIQIVRTAPEGQGLKTINRLGWWKFGEIRAANGSAVERHIQTYQRAFIAFFVCVLASIMIGGLLSVTAQN
jgi:hypothetical protein